MIAQRTGLERFLGLLAMSGAACAAWLLVPFAIGLALVPLEDSWMLDDGWRSTLFDFLFGAAWVLGLVGAIVMPALTGIAGFKINTPRWAIPVAVVVAVLAYGALSFLALLGLAEFYFPDDGVWVD